MQTGPESPFVVTNRRALLLIVFLQQAWGIQIQRVAPLVTGPAIKLPLPQWPKAAEVRPGRIKHGKEAREHGLAGHPLNAVQFGHQRIPPQTGDAGQFAGLTQQALGERQSFVHHAEIIFHRGGFPFIAQLRPRRGMPRDGLVGGHILKVPGSMQTTKNPLALFWERIREGSRATRESTRLGALVHNHIMASAILPYAHERLFADCFLGQLHGLIRILHRVMINFFNHISGL